MAFTRFWIRPKKLDTERFAQFSAACEKASKQFRGKLIDAVFNGDKVRFDAELGSQAFLIERLSSDLDLDGEVVEFCRTQQLPYDALVENCLRLLQRYFPEVTVPGPFIL